MKTDILEVKNITKRIRGRRLVDHISFTIHSGDICGFLGPNGSGKTTLIRMITGLIAPTEGEITVAGMNIQKDRRGALLKLGAIV
ncbi:ATP-binding cassette domain-containing protein [Aneurinibacillus tyrosinisolvens]|uniref:ATP-binding cassette domain-containing protein n=1 Tax=Aneurinibacillus tyrosinisolvens TaxID=1443435 RepID=UPI00063F5A78|nr:ATP-binding cassette domain-containing protein [Aneurinibacillus tyrosinisolvens]